MLNRRAVTKYLGRVKTNDVNSIMLFTMDGRLLTHTGAGDEPETTIAAISANIWLLYLRQIQQLEVEPLQEIIIELTEGKLVFQKIADFLVCIQGTSDITTALLRAKIKLLCENLQEALSLVAA